jgi:phosphoglycerate dehydrogenase-like enzyme
MLALSRNLHRTMRNQQRRAWERPAPTLLDGKTVGIFALGVIGSALAPKCKALGMSVIGVDPLKPHVPGVDRTVAWDEALRIVPELDYVVLLIPSTAQTRRIVGARFFAAMKPTSYLVNLGRGEVIDEEALVKALEERRIAGAALDVFSQEPLPQDHPLWSMDNVIITPHLGGHFDDYPKRALPIICENLRRFLAGDFANMINLVKR